MRKNIALICVGLAAALAAQGCFDTNIDMSGRSFKDLCEISGGQAVSSTVCSCGYYNNEKQETEWKPCAAGVVCIDAGNDGLKCASGSIIGQSCNNDGAMTCENDGNVGTILNCSKNDKNKLIWQESDTCSDNNSCLGGKNECGVCSNGSLKCNEQDEILKCELGEWIPNDADFVCQNIIEGGAAIGTYTRCVGGNLLYTCEVEGNSTSCADKESCGVCLDGEFKCNESNDVLKCEKGEWILNKEDFICRDKFEGGEEIGIQTRCVDGNLTYDAICKKDEMKFSCATEISCGECLNGAFKCDENNDILKCEKGKWTRNEAEFVCRDQISQTGDVRGGVFTRCIDGVFKENEQCINAEKTVSCATDYSCGECLNGELKCVEVEGENYAKMMECRNGIWNTLYDCNAPFCSSKNTCSNLPTGKCLESSPTVCANGIVAECKDEDLDGEFEWGESSCGNGIPCVDNKCGDCKDGDVRCNLDGSKLEVCNNGIWEISSCETGVCLKIKDENDNVISAKCAECKDAEHSAEGADTKCENDALYTCENGKWGVPKKCVYDKTDDSSYNVQKGEYVSCDLAGKKCGVCKDGAVYCEKGEKFVCQNGVWSDPIVCLTNNCASSTSCGECENNDDKCENNMHFVCNNGNWITKEVCEYGCKDTVNQCKACEPGSKKCENDEVDGKLFGQTWVCSNDGIWEEQQSCDKNNSCKNDKVCGDCINGEVRCFSEGTARLEVCKNGQWEFSSYCESGKCKVGEENPITCEPAAQVLCFDGMTKCEDNKIYRCENYEWIKTENECDETKACVDGEVLSCTNSYDGYGNLIVCRDGTYKTEPCHIDYDPSKPKSSCSNEKSCGECLSGWYNAFAPGVDIHDDNKCVMPTPQICINGLWKSVDRVECKPCEEPDNSTLNKDEFQSKKHPYIRCK